MTVQTIDTQRIKQGADLRTVAAQHTILSRAAGDKELEGPCPKCGGVDRFHVKADTFFCRQCYPLDNGRPHDAIAYIQWLHGIDFKEACAMLSGGSAPTTAGATVQRPQHREPQGVIWDQSEAQGIVRNASKLLSNSKHGEPGRAYLLGRGIEPATWEAFGLGYMPAVSLPGTWNAETKTYTYPKQPAIVIPWYVDGELRAIRYRFIEKHTYTGAEGKERKDVKSKSEFGGPTGGLLFGAQTHEAGARALVLCEGELNACAIWQATRGQGIDVLSIGSQDSKLTPAHVERIGQYSHVLAWLDERERAKSIMAALPGAAGMQSPRGKDANDWLQAGKLEGLIVGMLRRAGWAPGLTGGAWSAMRWHEKLIHCSEQLGITWRWLDDGRLWTSVDVLDQDFVRQALALFRQIDAELRNR